MWNNPKKKRKRKNKTQNNLKKKEVEQQEFCHQEYQPDEENQQINANGEEEKQIENGEEHFEKH